MTEPETNPETTGQQRPGLARLAVWVAGLGEGNRNAGATGLHAGLLRRVPVTRWPALAKTAMSTGLDQHSVGKTIASAQRTASPKAGSDRETAS